jgi:hypothetical protein
MYSVTCAVLLAYVLLLHVTVALHNRAASSLSLTVLLSYDKYHTTSKISSLR